MAIINSYPSITPTANDLVLITDASTEGNPTKTATIGSADNGNVGDDNVHQATTHVAFGLSRAAFVKGL